MRFSLLSHSSQIDQKAKAEYAVGTFNEEDEVEPQPQLMTTPTTIPGVPSPTPDFTTEIAHYPPAFNMSEFEAALALYVNKWSVSHEQYKNLQDVLHLLDKVPRQIFCLPARVDSVKKSLDSQLPLLTMRTRELQLDRGLLPTRSQQ